MIDRRISETSFSVIDLETTGLSAGRDRIVEISVVRADPGDEPRVVLDTLINPERRMGGTKIHGIRQEDVEDAPTFREVIGDVVTAIEDSVVCAYNVYFDIKFINDEFGRVGARGDLPHLCLMYLRPMLGLGSRCSLEEACRIHSINYPAMHMAGADAYASSQLVPLYLQAITDNNIDTFGDLVQRGSYKFLQSLEWSPCRWDIKEFGPACSDFKSRWATANEQDGRGRDAAQVLATHVYMNAVSAAVADRVIEEDELHQLARLQAELGLDREELFCVHTSIFSALLSEAMEDGRIDRGEVLDIRRLHACLGELGYAPGC